jgi:hypothetical protein
MMRKRYEIADRYGVEGQPLTGAQRARRARDRKAGRSSVPIGQPGRPRVPPDHVAEAVSASGALLSELGWLDREQIDADDMGRMLITDLGILQTTLPRLLRNDSQTIVTIEEKS